MNSFQSGPTRNGLAEASPLRRSCSASSPAMDRTLSASATPMTKKISVAQIPGSAWFWHPPGGSRTRDLILSHRCALSTELGGDARDDTVATSGVKARCPIGSLGWETHAYWRACLNIWRPREGDRARGRAWLRIDPDLQPEPAYVAAY